VQDREDVVGDLAVAAPARRDDDRVRAQSQRDGRRLGRVAPEHARLVRRGRDNAARPVRPDEQRLARQLRPVEHLDGGEERVHVDVEDGAVAGHVGILTVSPWGARGFNAKKPRSQGRRRE
jgi:hypothetical protein